MPKLKTHSGAKKKFKITGTGKLVHGSPYKNHNLGKKSAARKRRINRDGVLSGKNHKNMLKKLGK